MTSLRLLTLVIAAVLAVPPGAGAQADSTEELARRWLAGALKFLSDGRPAEGLKDLQSIVDSYPASTVADDALLAIAHHHLAAGAPAAAQPAVDLLIAKYPSSDSAPMGYVLAGRIGLAQAETVDAIDRALANFERVRTLFPRSTAVAAALTFAGDAHRVARRPEEARRLYQSVTTQYPRSPWAARALLGGAAAETSLGRPHAALEALSRVQSAFAGTPEAATARDWATILYRLHIRPPAAPSFAPTERVIGGTAGRLEDVTALAPLAGSGVLVLTRDTALRFDEAGQASEGVRGAEARAITVTGGDRLALATRGAIVSPGAPAVSLAAPRDGAPKPLENVRALAMSRVGQWLVADGDVKAVLRFESDGKHAGVFAAVDAARVAVSDTGLVAALERGTRSVVIYDATGKPGGRVPVSGAGYKLEEPVDIAWDGLGYLYVLDRELGAVVIFSPGLQVVANYSVPQRSAGVFRRATALSVDAAGRLFIYDDRSKVVRVHQ